jgi:hypothetical protein
MPTQTSLEFQEGQRYLKQPFSELLIGNASIGTINGVRSHAQDLTCPFKATELM